ncbi:hypothetical protein B0H16DRAFT_1821620 [Mycena metata]|uniref:Uncharacterized protein n=1 Tax=Mycena metata TaxID=1033252 RepID=A0AAD7J8D7_9AGAR|nr:hypothetical protein B0H16DRAFT_1821620 [Mycena metata]
MVRRLVSCLMSFWGPPAVLLSRLVIFPKSILLLSHRYIPNSMVRCAGYQNDFKGKGYTLHLKLTHNPPCVAISEAAEARTVHQKPSAEFGNIEIPAGPFEGDFFGVVLPRLGKSRLQSLSRSRLESSLDSTHRVTRVDLDHLKFKSCQISQDSQCFLGLEKKCLRPSQWTSSHWKLPPLPQEYDFSKPTQVDSSDLESPSRDFQVATRLNELRQHYFGEGYTPADFGYVDDSEDDGPPSNDSESDPESDDEIEAQERADLAGGYEPLRPQRSKDDPMPPRDKNSDPAVRKAAEDHFHHKPIVEKYHSTLAGKPIVNPKAQSSEQAYASSLNDLTAANPYAPFTSKLDWEVAKWAKLRGAGSTVFTVTTTFLLPASISRTPNHTPNASHDVLPGATGSWADDGASGENSGYAVYPATESVASGSSSLSISGSHDFDPASPAPSGDSSGDSLDVSVSATRTAAVLPTPSTSSAQMLNPDALGQLARCCQVHWFVAVSSLQ